jgi:hypothetical protein
MGAYWNLLRGYWATQYRITALNKVLDYLSELASEQEIIGSAMAVKFEIGRLILMWLRKHFITTILTLDAYQFSRRFQSLFQKYLTESVEFIFAPIIHVVFIGNFDFFSRDTCKKIDANPNLEQWYNMDSLRQQFCQFAEEWDHAILAAANAWKHCVDSACESVIHSTDFVPRRTRLWDLWIAKADSH